MKPVPMTIWIDSPLHTVEDQLLPEATPTTLQELCGKAKILCRVSGGAQGEKRIFLHAGMQHLRVETTPWALSYVGVGPGWKTEWLQALRVLEVLAYAFFDYEARECVSFRGLFEARRPVGRRPLLGRARTAAERMQDMRARIKGAH